MNLTAANTYTGPTTFNGGTLTLSADGINAGDPATLGAIPGAATPGDLVLDNSTLQAGGAPGNSVTLNANRGVALGSSSGSANITVNVPATITVNIAGIIANNGTSTSALAKTGPGTLILGGANTFSGGLNLNQGTVVITSGANLGAGGSIDTFTGNATLQFAGSVSFGGVHTIAISSGVTATVDDNAGVGGSGQWIYAPTMSGSGNFNFISSFGSTNTSVRLYTGVSSNPSWTYTGQSTVYIGTTALNLSSLNGVPYGSKYNPNNVLNLGGSVMVTGNGGPAAPPPVETLATYINLIADTSSQIVNGLGNSGVVTGVIGLANGAKLTLNSVNSNGIVRNPGSTLTVNVAGPIFVANGAVANDAGGIIGGWATAGNSSILNAFYISTSFGSDWATIGAGGAILPLASYTNDAWAAGNNTTVTQATNSPAAGSTTNSLRFVSLIASSGSPLSQTVTLSGNNVITSGGILVTNNVSQPNDGSGNFGAVVGTVNSTFTIAGGTLTSGNGTDLIVNQFNTLAGSPLTISSAIVDNGATPIGLTLAGNTLQTAAGQQGGTLILTNPANSYSGPTVINAATILRAGNANVIPAASAVIISMLGTLDLNGFNQSIGSLANFNGSLSTLAGLNFGYGTTVTAGPNASAGIFTLTIGNDNSSTSFNGALRDGSTNAKLALVKVGSGTLTLGNFNDNITNGTPNLSNYSGGTTITAGTLDILYDADLGAVPSVPTTNITFNGAGTLRFDTTYFGTSLSANRGIVVTSGQSGTLDTNGNNITYGGLLTSSGTFGKAGAGILEIDGVPTLNSNSAVSVTGGTLRLKYGSAPTIGGTVTAAVAAGATLELAGSVSQFSQSVNIANAGTLLDSSSANQNVGVVTSGGNTTVNTGGSLTAYEIRQNSLTITGNAKVTLLPSGSGSNTTPAAPNNSNFSSNVAALSIGGTANAWTGTLDIGNNGLVIQYGAGSDPFTTITNMVKSGYANGNWTGTGITSSLAHAAVVLGSPTPALNIGLIDFIPNTGTFGSSIVFEGQTITTNAVLVRLTYMDDLVLSGDMAQANATSDALFFAANYGSGTVWHVGDITHDGVIDTNDALLFAANYVVGLPSLDGTTGNAAALGGGAAAVPEPATVLLATLGCLAVAARAAHTNPKRK